MAVSSSTSQAGSKLNACEAFDAPHPRLAKTSRSRSLGDFDFVKPSDAGLAAPLERSRTRLYDASESQSLDNGVKEETPSGSCCLSSCIHRIYDFVCSLFRCLFCMKQKVKEPDSSTSLPKKAGEPLKPQRLEGLEYLDLAQVHHVQPDKLKAQDGVAQLKVTIETQLVEPQVNNELLSKATTFFESYRKDLKGALEDFKKLESESQNYILRFIAAFEQYTDLALYLEKGLDPIRKTAFETNYGGPFSVESADKTKLKAIFKKGF